MADEGVDRVASTTSKRVNFDDNESSNASPTLPKQRPAAAAGAAEAADLSDSTHMGASSAFFSDPLPQEEQDEREASMRAALDQDPATRGLKVNVTDDGSVGFVPDQLSAAGTQDPSNTSMSTTAASLRGVPSDASVMLHSNKAKEQDKSFIEVAAKAESKRLDEFDRQNVALPRKAGFMPVNPFQGDAIEMPDPMDDDMMGVELNETHLAERKSAKAFEEANHAKIEHHGVAGFNFTPSRGTRAVAVAHVEEDSVCFAAGRQIHVASLTDPKGHRVQPRTSRCVEIVAFAVSSNGKYVAVAERMVDAPHVTIYKTDSATKIASLNFKNLTTTYVEHLAFSSNNNFLLTATAQPHQRLVMWQLSDVKVVGVLDDVGIHGHLCALPGKVTPATAGMSGVHVNPWSSFLVATATDLGFAMYKLSGRTFSAEVAVSTVAAVGSGINGKPENDEVAAQPGALRPVVAVCWYDEHCCAALTRCGVLFAVEGGTVRQRLRLNVPPPPAGCLAPVIDAPASASASVRGAASPLAGSPRDGSPSPRAGGRGSLPPIPDMKNLVWASRGLLCSGADGAIVLLDRTYAEPCFVQTMVMRVGVSPNESGAAAFRSIVTCSVSPGETNVVVGLDDNTLLCWRMDDMNDALGEAENVAAQRFEEEEAERQALGHRGGGGERTDLFGEDSIDASTIMSPGPPHRSVSIAPSSPKGGANKDKDNEVDYAATQRTARQQELDDWAHGVAIPGAGTVFSQPAFVNPVNHLSFHSDTITSVSTCTQRPLIATTSLDKTLRIYDYEANTTIIVARMEDEILAGALHPTGLFVVLCFRYFTRVYALLPKGLHLVDDINIKPAHEVRFSNGGGRIAFAVNNRVILCDAHTFRIVGGLIGHASNVKSIAFSSRDETITTCDVAGIILSWDAATFERMSNESSQKNLIFQQVLLDDETGLYCAIGSSKHARGTTYEGELTLVCCKPSNEQLTYVRPGMIIPKAQATRKTHFQIIAMTRASRSVIIGTPTGRLLVYTWPLLKSSKPYIAIDNHCNEITHILISPDERFLFTIGDDKVMYVYDLLHMRDGRYVSATTFNWTIFDPVIFQHVGDADALERETFMLRLRVEERQQEAAATLANIRRTREREIKGVVDASEKRIDGLRKEIDKIVSTMNAHEKMTSDKAHSIEATHAAAAEEIEVLYSKRAREALARFARIESEREELAAQYEGKVAAKRQDIAASRQRLTGRIADRERKLREVITAHQKALRESVKKNDAMVSQTIADYETQLLQLEVEHKASIDKHDERTIKAANTASFGDREAERLRRDIVELQEQCSIKTEACASLQHVMSRREKENRVLKKELLSKQEAINQGEKRMLTLKQQLSKLENLRFVLTHQYEELRRSYIPKDGQIQALEARIRDMEGDLQALSFERNQVRDQVLSLDDKLDGVAATSTALRVKTIDQERRTKLLLESLGRLLDTYNDPSSLLKQLKVALKDGRKALPPSKKDALVEEAAGGESTELSSDAAAKAAKREQSNSEMHTQVEFLESKLAGLRKEEQRFDRETVQNNAKRIAENTQLIEAIQEMRRDRKELQARCNLSEQQLRDACVALHRLADPRRVVQAVAPMAQQQRLEQERLAQQAAAMEPPALLPPIDRSASRAMSASHDEEPPPRSKSAMKGKPTPGGGRASSTASATSSTSKKRPASKTPTPTASSSAAAKKKPAPGPLSAKKGAKPTVYQRTQLHNMIDQLDSNTDRMRQQQREVQFLRETVQELLADEESRLVSALKESGPSPDLAGLVSSESPDGGGDDASPSPVRGRAANAVAAANRRAGAAPAGSREGVRPRSQASFAQPTPGLDNDDDDVDWTTPVQAPPGAPEDAGQGRPMTPTRLPGSGGL